MNKSFYYSILLIIATSIPHIATAFNTKNSTSRAYALHSTYNLYQCAPHMYMSAYALIDCALQLCHRIGVMPLGQATSVYHQAGYGFSSGYTICQHASNHTTITLHVDDQRGNIYIDIFSSMRYESDDLADFVQRFFDAAYGDYAEGARG